MRIMSIDPAPSKIRIFWNIDTILFRVFTWNNFHGQDSNLSNPVETHVLDRESAGFDKECKDTSGQVEMLPFDANLGEREMTK